MLYVHRSNRTEELLRVLLEVVRQPGSDPLQPETIVVQGPGMERWLSQELSRAFGVWANPSFPFPRRFIDSAFDAVLGQGNELPWEPELVAWAIADLLPGHLEDPHFAPISHYLGADDDGRRRFSLAYRVADLFDHYSVYRPRLVQTWEEGQGEGWQPPLWRLLSRRLGRGYLSARAAACMAKLGSSSSWSQHLPPRVSLFGMASLPPLFMQILAALAEAVEVHLFVLSPSQEYWAEIRSRRETLRELRRRMLQQDLDLATVEELLHLSEGHPLLASLGRLGRELQAVLEGVESYLEGEEDLYRDPGLDSRLHALQHDLLYLHSGSDSALFGLGAGKEDQSIAVHACAGPLREVEVLHDQLVARFEADPTLQPRQVVVMAPDLRTYGPLVELVFTSPDRPSIPFRLADRSLRARSGVAEALLALCDLLDSRFTATEVLDFLDLEPVRMRLGLHPEEAERIRHWLREAGVRWGADGRHREEEGQPRRSEGTLRHALDRLLLGYAMSEGQDLYAGFLPCSRVEGSEGEQLGRLADLLDLLIRLRREAQVERSPRRWQQDLGVWMSLLFAGSQQAEAQLQSLRELLATVADEAEKAAFAGTLTLRALRPRLERTLSRSASAHGFLDGGVTVCELVPMRIVPFRVVCLLGLADDSFPRVQHPLGFDLMAQRRELGDRSPRDDDRYLFLEALLSARDNVLLTYSSVDPQDGKSRPPSTVVEELLDCLTAPAVADPPAEPGMDSPSPPLRSQLVHQHPLQPWSSRYFQDGGPGESRDEDQNQLFTYSRSAFVGARATATDPTGPNLFFPQPLPAPHPEQAPSGGPREQLLRVEDLARFLRLPAEALLRRRLGLRLSAGEMLETEREPLELAGLDRYHAGQALLLRRWHGDHSGERSWLRAAGWLPSGELGEALWEELEPEVRALVQSAQPWLQQRRPALEVDHCIDLPTGMGAVRLVGHLTDLYTAAFARFGFSRLGGAAESDLWLHHLLLNIVAGPGDPRESVLIGRAKQSAAARGNKSRRRAGVVRFRPTEVAEELLASLVQLYQLGQQLPLPLFPTASRAYAEILARHGDPARALDAAQKTVDPYRAAGELANPYLRLAYPAWPGELPLQALELTDPLPDWDPQLVAAWQELSFESLAQTLYGPLLAHREEL